VENNNPYASPSMDADNAAAEHCLLVDGNVNVGKNKEQGQLLIHKTKINAFLAQLGIDVR
jgi:hypothetical protein